MAKLNWSNVKKQSRIMRYGAEDISGNRIIDDILKSELNPKTNSDTKQSSNTQKTSSNGRTAICQYCKQGVNKTRLQNHIKKKCPVFRLQQKEGHVQTSANKSSNTTKKTTTNTGTTSNKKSVSIKPTGETMDLLLKVDAAGQIKINHLDPGRVVYVRIQYETRQV